MAEEAGFDLKAAHKFFAAECFNQAWDLLDKAQRTAEEDEQLVRLTMASHYHWTQREDYNATNRSVAYWQTARVFAVLGQAENARHYAQLCLQASREGVAPFFLGYAYEALARAEAAAGNQQQMEIYLARARELAEKVTEEESKKMLLDDLGTVR